MAQNGRPTARPPNSPFNVPENVFRLPDGADFDLGASLGVPAVTAHAL